jgi:hypothetical protein
MPQDRKKKGIVSTFMELTVLLNDDESPSHDQKGNTITCC